MGKSGRSRTAAPNDNSPIVTPPCRRALPALCESLVVFLIYIVCRNGQIIPFANGGVGKRQFPDTNPAMAPCVAYVCGSLAVFIDLLL